MKDPAFARRMSVLPGLLRGRGRYFVEGVERAEDPAGPALRVGVFATTPSWIETMLATSVVLTSRAREVRFVYWPRYVEHDAFVRGDRGIRGLLARQILGRYPRGADHPRLRVTQGDQLPRGPLDDKATEDLHQLSVADVKYSMRLDAVDLDDPEQRATFDFRRKTNVRCAEQVTWFLQDWPCDVVLVPNGLSLELGAVYIAASRLGIRVTTCDFASRLGHMMVSQTKPIGALAVDDLWRKGDRSRLDAVAQEEIDELMGARLGTRWDGFEMALQPVEQAADTASAWEQLGADPSRPLALLCTNVSWDPAVLPWSPVFASREDWVVDTIRFFASRPEWTLAVRVHPAEGIAGTAAPVASSVRNRFGDLPPNVVIIDSDDAVNTYDLMKLAAVGIVHSSTAGLEMVMRGVPLVTIGNSEYYYLGKGFTLDQSSRDDYFKTITRLLQSPSDAQVSDQDRALAWSFAHFYFLELPQPFPWHNNRRARDFVEWPPRRVLSTEGEERFGRTFDRLLQADEM